MSTLTRTPRPYPTLFRPGRSAPLKGCGPCAPYSPPATDRAGNASASPERAVRGPHRRWWRCQAACGEPVEARRANAKPRSADGGAAKISPKGAKRLSDPVRAELVEAPFFLFATPERKNSASTSSKPALAKAGANGKEGWAILGAFA